MDTRITIANSGYHYNDVDLSTATLTTLNWFNMKPVYFKEVLPGEEVDIDMTGTMRMLALNKPMMSNIRALTRTFFIPYRVIFPHWNAFISDTREKNKKYTAVPYVPVIDFLRAFIKDDTLVTKYDIDYNENLGDTYDFIVRDVEAFPEQNMPNNPTYANLQAYGFYFTKKGRRIYDILLGLGYNLNFGYTYDPDSIVPQFTTADFGNISLLNLMAYGKIVADWFTLPAYQDKINTLGAALDTLAENPYSANTVTNLMLVLSLCIDLHYMDDIFVSAWDNPVSPNNNATAGQTIKIVDITNNSTQANDASRGVVRNYAEGTSANAYGVTNGTPVLTSGEQASNNNNYAKNVTQYILNALQKLSSYMRRNQLVGYRPLDRYLARYGKKLSSEQLLRSIVLDESRFDIDINAVTSQADTVGTAANMSLGSQLGDYAGQGTGNIHGHIHFNAQDEFGVIVTVAYILPFVKYYQGLNPANLRIGLTDFYQPEFDGLGCEAIPAKSLYSASMNSVRNYATGNGSTNSIVESSRYPLNQAFGYAPRYYSYKTNPYATVSGDFRLNSRNLGMEQWHLFRKIYSNPDPNIQPGGLNLEQYNWQHNQRFTEGSSDDGYYNRIFQIEDGENDGFIVGFNFKVSANLPVKPLYDDAILNSDPDSEHQQALGFSVGGTRLQ